MSIGSGLQTDSSLQWIARVLLVACLWAAVWLVGGYYPFARFVCLSLLGGALILAWMEPLKSSHRLSNSKTWLVLAAVFVAIGLVQSLPLWERIPDSVTGVQQIRKAFGDEAARFPLTLSPWQTRTRLATISIGLVGFFVSLMLFHTRRSKVFLLASVTLCGIGQVFWGVVQAARFRNDIFWSIQNPGGSRPFGTFLNCNHGADFVGMSFACALGIAWWWYRDDSGPNSFDYETRGLIQSISASPLSVLLWLSMGWLLVGLAITVSRGGWMSFLVALCALPVLWKGLSRGRRGLLPISLLVSVTVAAAGIQVLGLGDRVERGMDELEVENVLSDLRFDHWQEVIPAVKHFLPLGSGLGTYGHAYLPFHPEPANGWFTYAHNQYLETIVELGIPGCLLLLVAMWAAFRVCRRLCSSERTAIQQGLGVAAMIAFLMQALHAITDFGLMMPANLLTLGVLLGAAANATHESTGTGQPVSQGWLAATANRLIGLCGLAFLTAVVGLSLFHQMADVRSDQLLALTEYDPTTQDPALAETESWIAKLEAEIQQSPENEYLLRRLIQLRIHHAQRSSFDRVTQEGVAYAQAWDATAIEGAIARLFYDGDDALEAEEKRAMEQRIQDSIQLNTAWDELEASRALNPVQPRTHFRQAQIAAVSGREWRTAFSRSSQLAVVDPSLSLGNGLLAWAANDQDAMVNQWRQTLQTDPEKASVITRLARTRLSDEEFVRQLIPDRWTVPYRLARQMNGTATEALRVNLLKKADSIAQATIKEEPALSQARATIARAAGDLTLAIQLLGDVAKANPDDAESHYRHALVLLENGQAKEAAAEARVALHLAPGKYEYSQLFERARKRQQRK